MPRALALAGALLADPAVAFAGGEHARQAAAELRVLVGDVGRLADQTLPERHRKGLRDRIGGGLAGLDLLLRLADEELGRTARPRTAEVRALRDALRTAALDRLRAGVGRLAAAYPLRVPGILPAEATPRRLAEGKRLHEQLCAGCHDEPDRSVERPAYDLFEEARRLPALELVARLIVGVRGDRVTGVSNPLSDEQIASLIAYYRGGGR